jgi:predicted secreted protein
MKRQVAYEASAYRLCPKKGKRYYARSNITSIRDNLLFKNTQDTFSVRNSLSNCLNTIMSVLGNEITDPFIIILVENHIFCALYNKTVYCKNFSTCYFWMSIPEFCK